MTTKARSTPRAHHPRPPSRMRLFVSGGTGVLGRALRPLAATASHELVMFPKAGRIRFSTFLQVPYSEGAVALRRDVARWSVTSPCDQIARPTRRSPRAAVE